MPAGVNFIQLHFAEIIGTDFSSLFLLNGVSGLLNNIIAQNLRNVLLK